jgi:hypothetical protein
MNVSFFGEKLICQSLLTIHTCGLKKHLVDKIISKPIQVYVKGK